MRKHDSVGGVKSVPIARYGKKRYELSEEGVVFVSMGLDRAPASEIHGVQLACCLDLGVTEASKHCVSQVVSVSFDMPRWRLRA